MKKADLINHINPFISHLLDKEDYEVEWYNPMSLLTPDRIDILVKYLYAKSLINKDDNTFHRNLYLSNIDVLNGFVEGDYSGKVGKTAFLDNYRSLIDDILANGYDENQIVPLNNDHVPCDGAHRIAIALAQNIKIPTIVLSQANSVHYNFEYFLMRGSKNYEIDYLATQYARLKTDTYMVLVWPAAKGYDYDVENILRDNGIIVYKKSIPISYNGLVNLQRVVYKNEPWIGGYYNDFNGVHVKAYHCYAKGSHLRAYLYESTLDNVHTKQIIRDLFGIEHHSVHINDSHEETIEIADLLFNHNALIYLNGATRKETSRFEELRKAYKNQIMSTNPEQYAIVGGGHFFVGVP